jgi:GT2 family glycosyltransferase
MINTENKLAIGVITYGKSTLKYLPYFFESLKMQTFREFKLFIFDNSLEADNENFIYLNENFPEIEVWRTGKNIGFANAYNVLLKKAQSNGSEFFLALNPDMVLDPRAIQAMLEHIGKDNNIGSISPKVLRWDFESKNKTNIIDSCGIVLRPGLRFADLGQSLADKGQFDHAEILGPSGCAALYRMSALEKIKDEHGYFDERMFMYKEDCDLAYRLFLAGWKSALAPDAKIYHDRTAGADGESDIAIALNRKNKSKQIKIWSYRNQQLIFKKYWKIQTFGNKIAILIYKFKMCVYAILFERFLLK